MLRLLFNFMLFFKIEKFNSIINDASFWRYRILLDDIPFPLTKMWIKYFTKTISKDCSNENMFVIAFPFVQTIVVCIMSLDWLKRNYYCPGGQQHNDNWRETCAKHLFLFLCQRMPNVCYLINRWSAGNGIFPLAFSKKLPPSSRAPLPVLEGLLPTQEAQIPRQGFADREEHVVRGFHKGWFWAFYYGTSYTTKVFCRAFSQGCHTGCYADDTLIIAGGTD